MGFIYSIVEEGGASGGASPDSALNFAALPAPADETGFLWIVETAQGTAWLPGGLGGNYYPEGAYYSNGTTWIFQKSAAQATQAEVNAGVVTDKFVAPNTFDGATKWSTKENVLVAGTNITIDRSTPSAPVISSTGGGGGGVTLDQVWAINTINNC
jgi:hypothetical protein